MTQVAPLGEPEPEMLEFEYDVASDFINAAIDESGVRPPTRWSISINLQEDVGDPAVRRRLREAHAIYHEVEEYPELSRPIDDPLQFLEQIEPWADKASGRSQRALDQARADAFTSAMNSWIELHGSPRLQKAVDRGYKALKLYAEERAAMEFPGAWVDTARDTLLRERTDPSEAALDLEAEMRATAESIDPALSVRIEWMVDPPRELARMLEADSMGWEADEVLAIYGYLGRYTLVFPLDDDCRRPVGGLS